MESPPGYSLAILAIEVFTLEEKSIIMNWEMT